MTAREFAYWLQGFFELTGGATITPAQAIVIRNHLNMVFVHEIDPSYPKDQQTLLNEAHNPQTSSPICSGAIGRTDVLLRC